MSKNFRCAGLFILVSTLLIAYPASAAKTTVLEQYPATEPGTVSIEIAAPAPEAAGVAAQEISRRMTEPAAKPATRTIVRTVVKPSAKRSTAHADTRVEARVETQIEARAEARTDTRAETKVESRIEERPAPKVVQRAAASQPTSRATRRSRQTAGRVAAREAVRAQISETRGAAPILLATTQQPQSDERGAYDPVPSEFRGEIAQRLLLVDRLIRSYGRAYDYRIHTVAELRRVLEQLDGVAAPADPFDAAGAAAPTVDLDNDFDADPIEEAPLPKAADL